MITGTDALGPFVDTGVGTQPTIRPSLEVETHAPNEVDSGSTIAPTAQSGKKSPHRPTGWPR